MKSLSYLIFILFCMGCDLTEYSLDERLANKITKQVAEKLKKDLDLYPCGSGGRMLDQIRVLSLSFRYYEPVDIETARKLLVTAVTEFINAVNANEEIRPYLHNYPFEAKNIIIRIFLQNLDGSEPRDGQLTVVAALEGVLDYDIRNPFTKRLETIYKERFEEAQKKIKREVFLNQLDNR